MDENPNANPMDTAPNPPRAKRGFAAMDPEKRREIARRGGQASGGRPENLRGVDRSEAGRKGGRKVVSRYGAGHMAEIGRHGGEKVVKQYGAGHMAEIGRHGGQARGKSRTDASENPEPVQPEATPTEEHRTPVTHDEAASRAHDEGVSSPG